MISQLKAGYGDSCCALTMTNHIGLVSIRAGHTLAPGRISRVYTGLERCQGGYALPQVRERHSLVPSHLQAFPSPRP